MRCRAMDENSSSCVIAAELKYAGVPKYSRENRVCQEAFFIIMLPSTGLLQASLFPPITSIPLPHPPPPHYHSPVKENAGTKFAFHFRAVTLLRWGGFAHFNE